MTLPKWPVERADELAGGAAEIRWPNSARSYVAGHGVCCGLTKGTGKPPRVHPQTTEIQEFTKAANERLRLWADRHAPEGFGWTSLQINVGTSSEWHFDQQNEGPSALMVVGQHLGGEFESWGFRPLRLDNEITLIDGLVWHRNHPAWEGQRVSFVAFVHSSYREAGPEEMVRLRELGFKATGPVAP